MLEKIHWDVLKNAVHQVGGTRFSFFAEQREEKSLEFLGRQQRSLLLSEEGSRLEIEFPEETRTFLIESIQVPDLYRTLGLQTPSPEKFERASQSKNFDWVEKRNRVDAAIRRLGIDLDSSTSPVIRVSELERKFLSGTDEAFSPVSQDALAQISLEYHTNGRAVSMKRSLHAIPEFWERIDSDPSFLESQLPKGWQNPWPAPEGRLPVLWSEEASSKLLYALLHPAQGEISTAKFQVRSQKFQRRLHYREPVAQGIAHAALASDFQKEKLLPELPMGLYVRDLKLESFDPRSFDAVFTLTDLALIHHGEVGEAVLPVTVRTSLKDFFETWEMFSIEQKTFGFWTQRKGSRFLTEVSAPQVFTRDFFVPGTVSPSHYW